MSVFFKTFIYKKRNILQETDTSVGVFSIYKNKAKHK